MSAQIDLRGPLAHAVLRPIRVEDVDRIVEIEEASYPFPWSRGIFTECLRVGYAAHGLRLGRELVGYCFHSCAAGESHLLNLCVHPDHQGRGYGSILLEHAIEDARKAGAERMFLEVRPSNPAAARLYLRRGFREVGRRREYYRAAQGREDAIVMELILREPRFSP